MKYMTFQGSCSFCCIANMIEDYEIDKTDREIIIEAGLPYIFYYDSECDAFSTGANLQREIDYKRFLGKYDFTFKENMIKKGNVRFFLKNHIPCMIGIHGEYGKHAMVFINCSNEKYEFVNPHRENDKQDDVIIYSKNELLERLDDINYIGTIEHKKYINNCNDIKLENILQDLSYYRKRIYEFSNINHSKKEIMSCRDALLRPVALDSPVMMNLIHENNLVSKLEIFQQQVFEMFHYETCTPCQILNMKLFDNIMDEYQEVVTDYWMSLNK